MLRRIFLIDGYVMIVVGLLLFGWPVLFAAPPAPRGLNDGTVIDAYRMQRDRQHLDKI
jgi:hypothetical protein